MSQIRVTNLKFRFQDSPETLFEEVSCVVDAHTRAGLVGRNGCGKSTLLNILLGTLEVSEGHLFRRAHQRIGYLPQEVRFNEAMTGKRYLWNGRPELLEMKEAMDDIADGRTDGVDYTVFEQYGDAGGYQFEAQLEKTVLHFRFTDEQLCRPLASLSGGEKTRLALAAIMAISPDLLLLDEPTNHLDTETVAWLESFLQEVQVPFLVISHDREFLDRCMSEIWELEHGTLRVFSGNYTFYREEKDREFALAQKQYQAQQRKIRQLRTTARERRQWAGTYQSETGSEGNAPVFESVVNLAEKAMKRAKNVEKRIDLMIEREEAKKPWVNKRRRIQFSEPAQSGSPVILRFDGVSMTFEHEVFPAITFYMERGARVAVSGPNGSGKSTLLKIVTGSLEPTFGQVVFPPGVTLAYFAQEYENLNLDRTIIEEILDGDLREQTRARTILGSLGLEGEKVYQRIETLSSGERSKVSLAKAVLSDADLLVLDEPTNHLEIQAREAIEEALSGFPGSILFVSHDRRFVQTLATDELDISTGTHQQH